MLVHILAAGQRVRQDKLTIQQDADGAIDFFGPVYSLPHAISGHNNYWYWGPGRTRGDIIITVGESREDVEKSFEEVVEAGKIYNPYAMPYENRRPIYIARKPKFRSVQELWPHTKKLI